jgi:predicted Zn-dependent protease with MMP-like domain
MDWRAIKAPSLAEFEKLAADAFARLHAEFRARCDGLVIRIEDFPSEEIVDEMELESPFDLLGLYHGTGEPYEMSHQTTKLPDMVFLYRRPMLDYWADYDETLGDLITHVLIHEIGHHFGLPDAAMHAIEAKAGR